MFSACDLKEALSDSKKFTLEKWCAEYNNAPHDQPGFEFTNYSRHYSGRAG